MDLDNIIFNIELVGLAQTAPIQRKPDAESGALQDSMERQALSIENRVTKMLQRSPLKGKSQAYRLPKMVQRSSLHNETQDINYPLPAMGQQKPSTNQPVTREISPIPVIKTTPTPTPQRRGSGDFTLTPDFHSAVAQSHGQKMSAQTGGQMESFFGHDFGNVRLHTGPAADFAAKSVSAKAFTMGNDIFFRRGFY